MRCLSCQYDLRNLTEHRCPECGRVFDPSKPETYATQGQIRVTRWRFYRLLAISLAAGCFYSMAFAPLIKTNNWPLFLVFGLGIGVSILPAVMSWAALEFLISRFQRYRQS